MESAGLAPPGAALIPSVRRFAMKVGRRARVAAGVAVLATAAVAGSFGPIVRGRVDRAAARVGGTVAIDAVRPAWNGVVLRGVRVRLEDLPSVTVSLDVVEVKGLLGDERVAVARGGSIDAIAPPSTLASEVAALRERMANRPAGAESSGARTRMTAHGLSARWSPTAASTERVVATGVEVEPGDGGALQVRGEEVLVEAFGVHATATGLVLGVTRGGGDARLEVATAREAFVDLSARPAPTTDGEATAELAPSPAVGAAESTSRLRAHAAALAAALDARTLPETRLVVDALTAKVRAHDDVLSVGPGRFELRREDGTPRRLVIEVAQGSSEGEARTLALRLAVPFGEGSEASPLGVEIHGGPIPLSALGVREGELGLLEPERAWLEADAELQIDDAARVVRFDGEGHLRGLSLRHAAIAEQPIRGLDLGFRGEVEAKLDGTSLRAPRGELQVGALRVNADGQITRRPGAKGKPDDWEVDLRWEVPLVACQSLLDAAPAGLLPLVSGSTMAGSLALKGIAKFDTAQLDRTYEVKWDAGVGCRMVAPRPQVAVERFLAPFKKTIYTPEGTTREGDFGPGTPDWTPGSRITHLMGTAVITAEDGRFERHGGFDHEAIRNSIRENIRARKFVRGASTISMQLAKNLYLPRDKTLSRKLEEAVLTLYLEQSLTKDQLMELYLNVVEFGPMVYGIGPAAQHYFRTSPASLSVSQCFYLASILPSPKVQHFAAGNAVSGSWMSHLRRLMKYAHHRGRLNDAELDEGMTEVPVFGSSSPIREAPEGGELDDVLRREPWTDGEGDG